MQGRGRVLGEGVHASECVSKSKVFMCPSPGPSLCPSPSPPPSPRLHPHPNPTIIIMSRGRPNKKKIMRVASF